MNQIINNLYQITKVSKTNQIKEIADEELKQKWKINPPPDYFSDIG